MSSEREKEDYLNIRNNEGIGSCRTMFYNSTWLDPTDKTHSYRVISAGSFLKSHLNYLVAVAICGELNWGVNYLSVRPGACFIIANHSQDCPAVLFIATNTNERGKKSFWVERDEWLKSNSAARKSGKYSDIVTNSRLGENWSDPSESSNGIT